MDKSALVEEDRKVGEDLLRILDEAGLQVKAAFWLYLPGPDEWRLFLAMPLVAQKGRKEAYKTVFKYLDQLEPQTLSPLSISVVEPSDHRVRLLRSAVRRVPSGSGVRLRGNVVDGVLVEDAYIYRVA